MLLLGRWKRRKFLLSEQNIPFLLPMSEKVNRKVTVLKVLLLAGCVKGKRSMV